MMTAAERRDAWLSGDKRRELRHTINPDDTDGAVHTVELHDGAPKPRVFLATAPSFDGALARALRAGGVP
jgi:hypothetical protein